MCMNILPSFCFFFGADCHFLQSYSPLYSFRKMTLYPQKQNENKTKLINRTYLISKEKRVCHFEENT